MRSLWKGSISFGLVNIPVRLYVASQEREFKFVMLHKKDHSQIRYARICKAEEKEVPWDEIVKGYEYEKGEYVILDEEDFKLASKAKSQSIDIVHFVDEAEVDTIYYTKPYFIEPENNAQHAYYLLFEALKRSKKVAIAKFILHNREHIGVVKVHDNMIILNELRYNHELVNPKELNLPAEKKVATKELGAALQLIEHLTAPFNPKEYKDTYTDEIAEIIRKKAKGRKIHPKGAEKKPSKLVDIMALLKASLKEQQEQPKKGKKRKAG
jgi:DNA end-binding protein Ku